jgi:hypothetical protein
MVEQQPSNQQPLESQFNSNDSLKKKTIDFVFNACSMACHPQMEVASGYSWETDFVVSVKIARSHIWKYTPGKIRLIITQLYKDLDNDIDEIDKNTLLSEKNRIVSKQKKGFEISGQVLELICFVLQNSPIANEYRTMSITDFEALIKNIRTPNTFKLFSSGDPDDDQ